jgi:acetyl-CoA acyltransferase
MIPEKAVIVDFKRTAFTRAYDAKSPKQGALGHAPPIHLLASVFANMDVNRELYAQLDDILVGCAFPEGDQGMNLARLAAVAASIPDHVPAATVNRFCGSSMHVIQDAAAHIKSGAANFIMCSGVESMSRIPMGGFNYGVDEILDKNYPNIYISMGNTAENLTASHSISRKEQEKFALASHFKAAAAQKSGAFDNEVIKAFGVALDDCVRFDASLEGLARLRPAFLKDGSVTAGTSSPVTDGASCVLVASESFARSNNLPILAEIVDWSRTGCAPEIMGIGPVQATRKLLERNGLTTKDIDIFELNEAFAAQALAVLKDLKIAPDDSRLNKNGGAIALGHPLGASGARITGVAAKLLAEDNATGDKTPKHALATMCIGGGMGIATLLRSYEPS